MVNLIKFTMISFRLALLRMEIRFCLKVKKVLGKKCKITTVVMEPIRIHIIFQIIGEIARKLIKMNQDVIILHHT